MRAKFRSREGWDWGGWRAALSAKFGARCERCLAVAARERYAGFARDVEAAQLVSGPGLLPRLLHCNLRLNRGGLLTQVGRAAFT
jgi:hypothetical protein